MSWQHRTIKWFFFKTERLKLLHDTDWGFGVIRNHKMGEVRTIKEQWNLMTVLLAITMTPDWTNLPCEQNPWLLGGLGFLMGWPSSLWLNPEKKSTIIKERKKEKKWYNGWQLNLNLIKCYFLSVRSLNLLDKRDWLFFLNFNGKEIRLWRNNSHKRKFKVTRAKIMKNALIILFL